MFCLSVQKQLQVGDYPPPPKLQPFPQTRRSITISYKCVRGYFNILLYLVDMDDSFINTNFPTKVANHVQGFE